MSDDNDANVTFDFDEHPLLLQGAIPLKTGGFSLNAQGDWTALSWGYKKAADILADHVLATFTSGDLIIYPILLLYRHHLELTLKDLIRRGNNLLDAPVKQENTHSLGALWKDCQTILERAGMPVNVPELPESLTFEACIMQFGKVDPAGESFRYPEKKNGNPILPPALDSIDLTTLRLTVSQMSFFLEIARDAIMEKSEGL